MRSVKEVFLDRTCYKFMNKPVDPSLLKEVYDITKLGPTSGNSCPLRIIFIQSLEEKEKLYKCLAETNIAKVKTAPITAIFAYDSKFYELMPKLFPNNISMQKYFSLSEKIAFDYPADGSNLHLQVEKL
ncbi:MAG: nitroreductase family protein [Rickettsia endosymbiont of Bryobia graminum]|nr:nitroreductase family protein [Rickettsia endosymbiont of Bryobia graminum]